MRDYRVSDTTNKPVEKRKIYTPQLMVMDISNKQLYIECENRMREAEARKDFNISVMSSEFRGNDENIFSASLIHHFPRSGGSVSYGDVILEHIPQPVSPDAMRIRLYIACPLDRSHWFTNADVQRAGMIGLIVQSLIAIELCNFNNGNTSDLRPYIPFFDSCWTRRKAEVPIHEQTMISGNYVTISEPRSTEMTPPVALLVLDKTAAQLNCERHLAKYIRKRLALLNQIDPNRLIHLVFLLFNEDSDLVEERDVIETMLDVSVIKSTIFRNVPEVASKLHRSLRDTTYASTNVSRIRAWRVTKWTGNKYTLQRTNGGAIASYLGAVVHEIGHLFKIPHTSSGIMHNGGVNIQAFFLPIKKINLAITEREFQTLGEFEDDVFAVEVEMSGTIIMKQILESRFDAMTMTLMSEHPLITHKPRSKMFQIFYEEQTGIVSVESGVRYLIYYTDDDASSTYSFTDQHLKKELILKPRGSSDRALIVSGEGNFFSVLVVRHD